MLFVQISDLHISGAALGDAVARVYGGVFDTEGTVARLVGQLNALDPRPDLVLLTGDVAARDGQHEDYEVARNLLALLEIPLLPVPGNHDRRAGMRAAFAHLGVWSGPGDFQCIRHEAGGLVFLGLDTLEEGEAAGRLCAERLAWVAAELDAAAGRPVVIFMHHPPFALGWPFADPIRALGGEALAAPVLRHGRVAAILCGHLHRPVVRAFAGTVGFLAPAAGRQGWAELRPGFRHRWTDEPPAFVQHLWHEGALTSFVVPVDPAPAG